MSSRTGGIRLLGLLHGGPGHKAGLQEGDRILEVDGVPYKSITQRITLPSRLLVEQRNEQKQVHVEARSSATPHMIPTLGWSYAPSLTAASRLAV